MVKLTYLLIGIICFIGYAQSENDKPAVTRKEFDLLLSVFQALKMEIQKNTSIQVEEFKTNQKLLEVLDERTKSHSIFLASTIADVNDKTLKLAMIQAKLNRIPLDNPSIMVDFARNVSTDFIRITEEISRVKSRLEKIESSILTLRQSNLQISKSSTQTKLNQIPNGEFVLTEQNLTDRNKNSRVLNVLNESRLMPSSDLGITYYSSADGCGGILNASKGALTYPGPGLGNYLDNLHCTWSIQTTPGKIFLIDTLLVDKRKEDILEINTGGANICYYNCDFRYSVPTLTTLVTITNEFQIRFLSDDSNTGAGFAIKWMAVDAADICNTGISAKLGCANLPEYCMERNLEKPTITYYTADVGCKGFIKTFNGILTYPGPGRGNYSNNINCTWSIQTTIGKVFLIEDLMVDLRIGDILQIKSNGGSLCRFHVYDYKYQIIPTAMVTLTNSFEISFRSDDMNTGLGFVIKWTEIDAEDICNTNKPVKLQCGGKEYCHA